MCPPQGLHKFPKKRNVFSRVSCCCPPQQESQHGLPGNVPLFASFPPAPPAPPSALTRPPGLGEKGTTTHSFTTFSTTAAIFPAPLPQAGRPGAHSAQAPGPNGDPVSSSLCAGARALASEPGRAAAEPDAHARRTRARAPSRSLQPRLSNLEKQEAAGRFFCPGKGETLVKTGRPRDGPEGVYAPLLPGRLLTL